MKVNVGETKMMAFKRGEITTKCDILIEGEKGEQVKKFVYLGSPFINDDKHDRDIGRRMNAINKVNGALLAIMNSKSVSRQVSPAIHNGVLIPTLMYGSESWVWQKKNKSRINAVEMRSLRSTCGVFRKDKCRKGDVRERCVLKEDAVTTVEKGMLRWFGHLERMNERRIMKQIYRGNVCDVNVDKGCPRKFYANHIGGILKKGQSLSTRNRRACMKRLMDVSEAREACKDRTMRKSVVFVYPSRK
ncbi:hypothetical protein EVAR_58729_1 [Eumeta japonica]|uniref:Reverse transcriptase n=1 Tax=Eumeta variegata TaxID=151549 RepID=A0A4C1YRG5_EUMVA|nr:hypothetical protein EVAR_58729_1 [Eumeta japonica]